jgi:hypothetical protein
VAFALVLDKFTQFGALCSAALALVVFGLVRAGGGGTAAATASSFVVYNSLARALILRVVLLH